MVKYNKKISLLGVLIFLCVTNLLAHGPDTLWTKIYGIPESAKAYSVQQTSDLGYIITGTIKYLDEDDYDVWLLKTDSLGDTLWTKTYGGKRDDCGRSVQLIQDKGYMIAGHTASYGAGEHDFYLIKTDSLGDVIWAKTYGGLYEDFCFSAQQTFDNGYIMAGKTRSFGAGDLDFYVVKTDSNGDTLWTKTYGGGDKDVCVSVQQTSDHGYIFAGGTVSFGGGWYDVWLIKTDSLGDTLWTRTYGGEDVNDVCRSVQQTFDGGYIMTGTAHWDIYLIRTDENGDTLWTRSWGGPNIEDGFSVIQIPDSNYIVAGRDYNDYAWQGPCHCDAWLLKVDKTGDTLWTKRYGDTLHNEYARSVQRTSDDGYILAGIRNIYDVYLVKLGPEPGDFGNRENHIVRPSMANLEISPNPFSEKTDIRYQIPETVDSRQYAVGSIRIYDISGRLVKSFSGLSSAIGHQSSVTWDGSDNTSQKLPSGVYFLKFEVGDNKETRKLILSK